MRIWLSLLVMWSLPVSANTYVGNGGGQGDVEFLVALRQVQEVFQLLSEKGRELGALCHCNKVYQGRAICAPLNELSEEQSRFCRDGLVQLAPQVQTVLSAVEPLKVQWTHAPIEVREEGKLLAVDAVASRSTREITVNQARFLGLPPAERVFLLSHELFHFTDLDSKPVVDEGEVGPFKGGKGGRQFVNSMAAASAVLQGEYPKLIHGYKAKLSRSQAWHRQWLSLDYGGSTSVHDDQDMFAFNNYQRVHFKARYQWAKWGIEAGYRYEFADKKVLDTIEANEKLNIFGLGMTYRWFMSSDPLSFWGQSHLLVHGLIEHVQAAYEYHDESVGESAKVGVWGANVGASYYIPMFWGVWHYVGVAYEFHPYQYNNQNLDLNRNKNQISGFVGVSYAF